MSSAVTSATEIASAVRSQTLHAVDVVTAALERIERADPVLSAFIEVWGEEALRRARDVDARVGAGERLPLAGVPIGVKGRRGLRTAGPLLAAGCVAVGATSVPGPGTPWQTWGLGRYGRTANPWRPDRTPGGSSAGSAAAVAAGLVPLATGSDGAGSVRIPAAWCGVVGLKAGNGRLPSADPTGLMAPGVFARCVADVASYWDVMSGGGGARDDWARDGGLPGAGAHDGPGGGHDRSVGELPRSAGADDRPVGGHDRPVGELPRSIGADDRPFGELPRPVGADDRPVGGYTAPTAVWSRDLGFDSPDPDVVAVAHATAVRLAEAGAIRLVRPRTPLCLDDPAPAWLALRVPRAQGAQGAQGSNPGPEALHAHRIRAANDSRLADLFTETELLLTPTTPTPPHGHDGPGDRYSTALTWAFNLSGHPAISIPAGLDGDGCPVGLQLVAAHGREGLLLDVARAAESAVGPWTVPCVRI
ncbi:amidase [Streptomyces sp. AC550_RSS872]|uniref:amidase n=1 Tax=Streptomyces sp. AC550_RSS872 TaxID=2823689 RepID=UPI001C275816|nr:amidase [Streptomyces sp. AC550_RSS872]